MNKNSELIQQNMRVRQSQKDIVEFADLCERMIGNGVKKPSVQQADAVTKSQRKMADYAVLHLAELLGNLESGKTIPTDTSETLRLVIQTIQVLRLGLQSTKGSIKAFEVAASAKGKLAAESRHNKAGGSRSKADEIRRIWNAGNFSSRDLCAEQNCAVLEMSFSAARKALRNTPDAI